MILGGCARICSQIYHHLQSVGTGGHEDLGSRSLRVVESESYVDMCQCNSDLDYVRPETPM